jgi:hypothetical protein
MNKKRTQLPEAQNVESTAAHCNVVRYDLANSRAALRLQGEAGFLRQLQKPSLSVGNDTAAHCNVIRS